MDEFVKFLSIKRKQLYLKYERKQKEKTSATLFLNHFSSFVRDIYLALIQVSSTEKNTRDRVDKIEFITPFDLMTEFKSKNIQTTHLTVE